jgi:DNA-directed RNA polymerase subunit K/omega
MVKPVVKSKNDKKKIIKSSVIENTSDKNNKKKKVVSFKKEGNITQHSVNETAMRSQEDDVDPNDEELSLVETEEEEEVASVDAHLEENLDEVDNEDALEGENEESAEEEKEAEGNEVEGEVEEGDDCMYNYAKKSMLDDLDNDGDDEDDGIVDDVQDQQGKIITDPAERETAPMYTKYEYVRVKGDRAKQLSLGAKPLVRMEDIDIDTMPPDKVAEYEIKNKSLPFIIDRTMPNGAIERWRASELSLPSYLM